MSDRQDLREKLIRELRAGFLERDRGLALLAASNVAEMIEQLVRAEVRAESVLIVKMVRDEVARTMEHAER